MKTPGSRNTLSRSRAIRLSRWWIARARYPRSHQQRRNAADLRGEGTYRQSLQL